MYFNFKRIFSSITGQLEPVTGLPHPAYQTSRLPGGLTPTKWVGDLILKRAGNNIGL
jgi:hypothetical protein